MTVLPLPAPVFDDDDGDGDTLIITPVQGGNSAQNFMASVSALVGG